MKKLIFLFVGLTVTYLPSQAGTIGGHSGGSASYSGGSHATAASSSTIGGSRSYSGNSYGGGYHGSSGAAFISGNRGYSGGTRGYSSGYAYEGNRSYYRGYGNRGYGYSGYGYGGYGLYGYSSLYGGDYSSGVYAAPPPIYYGYDGTDGGDYTSSEPSSVPPSSDPSGAVMMPSTSVYPSAPVYPGVAVPQNQQTTVPTGQVDASGYIHSPFSNSAFKVDNVADGQTFHDPLTGQLFQIHVAKHPATGASVTGKLDEFGYVHSPFSTYTFKVQDGNYNQVFHDPMTGQAFTVVAAPSTTSPTVAASKTSD